MFTKPNVSGEAINGSCSSLKPTEQESVAGRFAKIVAAHGGRVALRAGDVEWTYAELDQRSTALANRILDRLGEQPEPVALLMEHGAPLITGILAVLKAGRIYLVLDPGQPVERLAVTLADAGARLLLNDKANAGLAGNLASGWLQISEVPGELPAPADGPLPDVQPSAGAWLMYTSGSTGRPKGVWQNHSSIVHHADVYRDLIRLVPGDRVSLLTSCGLAASGSALFAALLNGATLCPFHVRSQGVERLAAWLARERITVYHSVPTVFRHLARAAGGSRPFESVRSIRLGGEPVLRDDVGIFRRHCADDCRLMHALSSTETGLISAWFMDKQAELPGGRVPVGRPIQGVEVNLLDAEGRVVEPGSPGRIAVRSAHLREGYWRRPEATAERFRTDPRDPRVRTFLSNDLGRFLPDGSLEHLGREDDVVKIRGQRADLAEVDAALRSTGLFEEAAAAAEEDGSGERRLVAYVVPRSGADMSAANCRRALRELPEHMVPGEFVSIERLPQTPGGKVDRRALVLPTREPAKTAPNSEAPHAGVERNIAKVWESVLGISGVGRRDDFFDLGGTSIQSALILSRIEERYGVTLAPSTIVEHSTVAKLAGLVGNGIVRTAASPLIELRSAASGRPLFLVHNGKGDVAAFGRLARLIQNRPIYGFQSPGLDGGSSPLTTIPAMARLYLREMIRVDPTGPYLLAGSCMGAWVAFEMAQQLVKRGLPVGFVGNFDFPPGPRTPRLKDLGLRVQNRLRILRWKFVRTFRRKESARWLPKYRRFVAQMNGDAGRRYRPAIYPGTLTLFGTTDSPDPHGEGRLSMGRYARDVRVVTIEGNRAGLFLRPTVDNLAERLEQILADVEALK